MVSTHCREQRACSRGRGGWALLRSNPGPAPAELVCNRTFDKYSCWPDTPPNTTANISCPWYLPWYHKGNRRRDVGGWPRGSSVGVGR